MSVEMKPCAFCGEIVIEDYGSTACDNSQCPIFRIVMSIATWNRRFVCNDKYGKKVFEGNEVMLELSSGKLKAKVGFTTLRGVEFVAEDGTEYNWDCCGQITLIESED